MQAAILRVKLKYLNAWNQRRNEVASRYQDELKDLPLVLPLRPPNGSHVWHIYVIRAGGRDMLQERLRANGVQTLIHYPIPPHKQKAYESEFRGASFPLAESIADEALSLPMGPHISDVDVSKVIEAISIAMRG